jgi:hypothetical protein
MFSLSLSKLLGSWWFSNLIPNQMHCCKEDVCYEVQWSNQDARHLRIVFELRHIYWISERRLSTALESSDTQSAHVQSP